MIPQHVLDRWPAYAGGAVRAFGTGLINKTFLVERDGARAIFQRLHPIFGALVNDDIDAVTAHLAAKGVTTTRVIPTGTGALCVEDKGEIWRALSFIDGESVDRIDNPQRAYEGAKLVAKFHGAVADLEYAYQHVRAGVHDTPRHMSVLAKAVDEHRAHRLFSSVEPMAKQILATALPDFAGLPLRNCHGDLKISNVLFDRASGAGVCLVDLDTLGRMIWPHEMGDALRSWTNPLGEDVEEAAVDVDVFRATVDGYAAGGFRVTPEEKNALVAGMHAICTELSARFLADALNESYFGWSSAKYATRGDHNLTRARGQWSLAQSVAARRSELDGIVASAL